MEKQFIKELLETEDDSISHLGKVSISGMDPIPAYILNDEDWNGWAIPYFEKDVILGYLAKMKEANKGNGVDFEFKYDEEADKIITTDEMGSEEAAGYDLKTPDGVKHLYDVGGRSWIWEEETIG